MSCWAVVPQKSITQAKQRLAQILPDGDRRLLAARMLAGVLVALQASNGLDGIIVVGGEGFTLGPDITVLADPAGGLNPAITHAGRHLRTIGATSMLVVPADLPLITAADISAILELARSTPVVIAPDRHGCGTNALFMSPPDLFAPMFGSQSLALHIAAAKGRASLCQRGGLAQDVDVPDDLRRLQQRAMPGYRFLAIQNSL